MFFSKNDRDQIKKILTAAESNRIQLHHFSSEISDSIRIIKRLESVIEQLINDFETLKSRMYVLESKIKPSLLPSIKPLKKIKKPTS
jgi:hypothetical protein